MFRNCSVLTAGFIVKIKVFPNCVLYNIGYLLSAHLAVLRAVLRAVFLSVSASAESV